MIIILSIMLIICSICLFITTFLYLRKQNHVKNLILRIHHVADENYKLRNDNLNLKYDVDDYKTKFERIEEISKLIISTTENEVIYTIIQNY